MKCGLLWSMIRASVSLSSLCKQSWTDWGPASGDPRNIILDGSPDSPHSFDMAFAKLLWPLVGSKTVKRVTHTLVREKLMLDNRDACSPSACSEASVTNLQPPMCRSLSLRQLHARAIMPSSPMLTQRRRYTTCRYLQPDAKFITPNTNTLPLELSRH